MKIAGVISGFAFALVLASAGADSAPEPFFEGLGSHTRKISTDSPEAQKYFDQGLNFLFGFNHAAAIRAFQAAEKADPTCAMVHWGTALACGPHINFPHVSPSAAELAWKELVLAQENVSHASAVENALIEALGHRYANSQPEDRSPLDRAYADAMRGAWKAHGDDPDVGALFAEAMMDLRPWDQWTPGGQPQPGTEEILATLNAVLKLDVNHPLANHLYIHAVEASPHPELADAAADRLRQLQPGLAHNVHMPSHIDIRRGRWQEAIDENLRAIVADDHYHAVFGPPQDLLIIYAAHNQHMLAYAAMMTGQSELAVQHIRAMVEGIPLDFVKEHAAVAESFVCLPYEVLIRFGRWDDILAAPDHPDFMPLTRAIRFAARGIALAAKGDVVGAKLEQHAYLAAVLLVPPEQTAGPDTRQAILPVVTPMLAGEILYREGRRDEGLAVRRPSGVTATALTKAVWPLSVRTDLPLSKSHTRRSWSADAEMTRRPSAVGTESSSLFADFGDPSSTRTGLCECRQTVGAFDHEFTIGSDLIHRKNLLRDRQKSIRIIDFGVQLDRSEDFCVYSFLRLNRPAIVDASLRLPD